MSFCAQVHPGHHCEPFRPEQLHVITMISNPAAYESRYRLFFPFAKRMEAAGVTLHVAEIATGESPHVVTSVDNPRASPQSAQRPATLAARHQKELA